MSAIARRFSASPARVSSVTWKVISELICQNDGSAAAEFAKISGVASCLINEKLFAQNPLVVKNKGPRLRVYCLYGEDAISGENANEDALTWKPTADEWHVFLPCTEEEFEDTATSLKGRSVKFTAYNVKKGIPDDEPADTSHSSASAAAVDWEAYKNYEH